MPKATVLYHYLYPDDVISARHFDGLCEGLVKRGWSVLGLPCNRGLRNEKLRYPLRSTWNGITYRRVWRPPVRQASSLGQIINSAWMLTRWSMEAIKSDTDVLIVGTNPVLSVLISNFWKRIRPEVIIAHWCFDLYPEAAIAEGMVNDNSIITRILKPLLKRAYSNCDLVADIGPCMRDLLDKYDHGSKRATLVPWALYEPSQLTSADPAIRRSLFGEAKLGLMYSGNFGRAHSFNEFVQLARILRGQSVHFSFGVRGNAASAIRDSITTQDTNISFAGFAPESELNQRLVAPDIHLVSLKQKWTGAVVPSKFFGSLAVGRPVIFCGSMNSSIARWIDVHRVGWVIHDRSSLEGVANEISSICQYPERLRDMRTRCLKVYTENFSMNHVVDQWDNNLRLLMKDDSAGRNPVFFR